ncbi:MAG: alkaline phosphatase family protein [Opitutales bacterium]|nr:alkaline phosphatase family protein [Opitutales bacterium]
MKKISVYMFIDALGWEIVNKYGFLENELLHRRKIEMQFGYSSTAMPTILSGETPDKHGHFSFFYYDPKNSPFKKFKYMKFLFGAGLHPKCLFNRGRIRRVISKLVAKYFGYTGYFSLYGVPFEQLPYFDYCEKNDIFAKNGLSPVKNLFDVLEESGLNFHISDWRKSESQNIVDAKNAIKNGAEFAFIYSGEFDSFMHDNVFDDVAIKNKIETYAEKIRDLIAFLKDNSTDFDFTIISDHGMTPTKEVCDLAKVIKSLKLKFGKDYVSFLDSTMARIWYPTKSEEVKNKIRTALQSCKGRFISEDEKRKYGIDFPNAKYGEDIFLMDEGVQISPCDLGAKALNGMHGYSPDAPDSYACLISTKSPQIEPKNVKDFFALMKNDIENLRNGSLAK